MNTKEPYSHSSTLRIAYNGDYPGYPCAWLDNVPLSELRVFTLLSLFGIKGGNEYGGLRKLLDQLGARPIVDEHETWEGTITVTATKTNHPLQ
jgi:hypothetical protein